MNPQQNKCNKTHTSHIIVKLLKSKIKKKLEKCPPNNISYTRANDKNGG